MPRKVTRREFIESGTRVPAIVRWPGRIPDGHVTSQAAITMDWQAQMLPLPRSS